MSHFLSFQVLPTANELAEMGLDSLCEGNARMAERAATLGLAVLYRMGRGLPEDDQVSATMNFLATLLTYPGFQISGNMSSKVLILTFDICLILASHF